MSNRPLWKQFGVPSQLGGILFDPITPERFFLVEIEKGLNLIRALYDDFDVAALGITVPCGQDLWKPDQETVAKVRERVISLGISNRQRWQSWRRKFGDALQAAYETLDTGWFAPDTKTVWAGHMSRLLQRSRYPILMSLVQFWAQSHSGLQMPPTNGSLDWIIPPVDDQDCDAYYMLHSPSISALWSLVGVSEMRSGTRLPSPEKFFLDRIEWGLRLIGDAPTMLDVAAFKVKVHNDVSLKSPEFGIAESLHTELRKIGIPTETVGVKWRNRFIEALISAYQRELAHDVPTEIWIGNQQMLECTCRQPLLVSVVQTWAVQYELQEASRQLWGELDVQLVESRPSFTDRTSSDEGHVRSPVNVASATALVWDNWSIGLGIASVFLGSTFGLLPIITIVISAVAQSKPPKPRHSSWKSVVGLIAGSIYLLVHLNAYGYL